MRKENLTKPRKCPNQRAGAKVVHQCEGGIIRIGESIDVVVLKARDGHARLIIGAPRNLDIKAPKSDGPSASTLEPSAK